MSSLQRWAAESDTERKRGAEKVGDLQRGDIAHREMVDGGRDIGSQVTPHYSRQADLTFSFVKTSIIEE